MVFQKPDSFSTIKKKHIQDRITALSGSLRKSMILQTPCHPSGCLLQLVLLIPLYRN